MEMKGFIKSILGQKFINTINLIIYRGNLNKLAQIFNTDKFGKHYYTPIYMQVFKDLHKRKLKILEIGVGGYDNPKEGGASLKMWKEYFYKSQIFAIDIHDKSKLEEHRIKIFQGSQFDANFLNKVIEKTGICDIIIDDGSHINEHVVFSFKHLFPKLKNGGIYVIEDTQTAYWDEMGGDSKNINNPKTSMNFFKSIIDAVNNEEFAASIFEEKEYLDSIKAMHFYHNLIFIFKK